MPNKKIYEAVWKYENFILSYLIKEQIFKDNISNAVSYFLDEHFTNYLEHSRASEFRIISQLSPQKDILEICLLDNGRGLTQSYLDATPTIMVENDFDAM